MIGYSFGFYKILITFASGMVSKTSYYQKSDKSDIMRHKLFLLSLLCILLSSCADNDDARLEPINTSKVKISANVTVSPSCYWMNKSEELSITVSDVVLDAPKGVVIRNISVFADDFLVLRKPYFGETLDFKFQLERGYGKVYFSVRAELIKQNSRDAEIIIKDNIPLIVFSETPKFECEGNLNISVRSTSTSGEEHINTFEVKSGDDSKIIVPANELYWTPSDGEASTLQLTISSGATAWSPNTTFDCAVSKTAIGNSTADNPTLEITIPNSPGALNNAHLQEYVICNYSGIWENVTITPLTETFCFDIVE